MGISAQNETFSEGLKNALSAIEVALGRGGDQVVINNQNQYTFFGGNIKEIVEENFPEFKNVMP